MLSLSMSDQEPICKVDCDGTKRWYLDGDLHRPDGPAIVHVTGTKRWYLNGKRHRIDGPAIEYGDGDKQWWLNGKCHRVDGPAIVCANGYKTWYLTDARRKPIEVFKAATHEQKIHMLCFYASEFLP
jgi:hypothetical protein